MVDDGEKGDEGGATEGHVADESDIVSLHFLFIEISSNLFKTSNFINQAIFFYFIMFEFEFDVSSNFFHSDFDY